MDLDTLENYLNTVTGDPGHATDLKNALINLQGTGNEINISITNINIKSNCCSILQHRRH